MRWNVPFIAAILLVAASQPSVAQFRVDMNQITCGGWLGYSPEQRDLVRFWMSGYYNAAGNSNILNYDRFQKNSAKVTTYCKTHKSKRCRLQSRTSACGSDRRIASRRSNRKGHTMSDVRYWHKADILRSVAHVRYWG